VVNDPYTPSVWCYPVMDIAPKVCLPG